MAKPEMDTADALDERKTVWWWRTLSALAALNLCLFASTAAFVDTSRPYVKAQLALAGVYTAVCAFRSFLPRIDLERYVLVDGYASSIAVGRSAATVAEVAFAAQLGLLLHELGGRVALSWLQEAAPLVVVLLALAQVFCWSSVVSLSHLGHAIEESLWAITLALVGVGLGVAAPRLTGTWHAVAVVGVVCAVGYVLFMVLVDVPMYVRRWRRSVAAGGERRGLVAGFQDALHRRVVTRAWSTWRPEVAWLTGYFTCAVWLSLLIVLLPR